MGCQFRPMTMQTTMPMTPMIVEMPRGALRRYTKKPKIMAIRMNMMEMMAVEALAEEAA